MIFLPNATRRPTVFAMTPVVFPIFCISVAAGGERVWLHTLPTHPATHQGGSSNWFGIHNAKPAISINTTHFTL